MTWLWEAMELLGIPMKRRSTTTKERIVRYMLVEDPEKAKDSATESLVESLRSMSNETVSSKLQNQPHGVVMSTVTIWRNGYTVDDSRLKSFDNPENVAFVEVRLLIQYLLAISLYLIHLSNIMFYVGTST